MPHVVPSRKPEIMSPAGYWPQLRAAIEAGADAVYFGLKHFSARAKVGFSLVELPEVMTTLHKRGARGYLTFNTLAFEHELAEAAEAIAAIAEAGADALIVQDVGLVKLARQIAPGLELHASTQMSITDADGVRLVQSLGIDRVTLARELSLEETRRIIAETDCELEIFVHGALCVAYSGQCFSSEAWGGRSANRGQCAQACRLPYQMVVDGRLKHLDDARYLLSPGDLYALEQVPEIVEMGVAALKIEGRYKDAEYVALTTHAYREAVDAAWTGRAASVPDVLKLQLEQVYSRGLGPFFLTGTNHQVVVRGRAPRHRGVCLGRVAEIARGSVMVEPGENAAPAPLKPGDGIVFDAAAWRSPEEPEEGGRVYAVLPALNGQVELRFANNAIRFERIRPGDLIWRTHDSDIEKAARPFTEAAVPVAKQLVDIRAMARVNAPLVLEWTLANHRGLRVSVKSEKPLKAAEKHGISAESLREQLGRLGNTPYELGNLDLDIAGAPFIPTSVLNQLRRRAVEELQSAQAAQVHREIHAAPAVLHRRLSGTAGEPKAPQIHLLVRTPEQLEAAISVRPASITLDYLDLFGLRPSAERVKAAGLQARAASPRVLKPGEARISDFLVSLDCPILVRPGGMLEALRDKAHQPLIGDFSLNAANALSARIYLDLGLERITPTHDLNAAQVADFARDIGPEHVEVVAYQHLPVFHTEHCVFCRFLSTGTSFRDCGRPCEQHPVTLRDQNGRHHPVIADVGCRNTVFGAEAQQASEHLADWRGAGISHFRLEFVHESADQLARVYKAFALALSGAIRGEELGRQLREFAPEGTTQGSLYVPKNYLTLPVL
jgi:putative protease